MTTYERVTYRDGRRTRTVVLEIASETDQLLTGFKVDSEGTRVAPPASFLRDHDATDGDVKHIIEKELITRRAPLVADYTIDGKLVPAGTAAHERR